jgi:hypothetical protein
MRWEIRSQDTFNKVTKPVDIAFIDSDEVGTRLSQEPN